MQNYAKLLIIFLLAALFVRCLFSSATFYAQLARE
jgi:hypothetical protein